MATSNGTAMTVAGPAIAKATDPTRAFEPRDISEGYDLAKLLVASGLMPRGVQRPEAAFAIIAAGRELGLTAMQSLRSIHIIEGKPTLSADLVAALCKSRSDVCLYFRLVESSDRVATYETHRKGEPEPTRMSFTIEEAQRAGVTGKDNWKKYTAAMLRARCITALARAVYPDLAMGVYDPDEMAEPAPVNAGPAEVIEPPRAPARKPAPKPAEVVDDGTWSRLTAQLDAAETVAAINGVVNATVKAHKAGKITDGNLAAMKSAVARKRDLVARTASAPVMEDEGPAYDDAAEAEADVMAAQHDGGES